MKQAFDILKATRQNYLKAIDGLSLEALNTIPKGFNNNIIWNVTHVIVTSKPKRPATQAEVAQSIEWLKDSVDWIKEDYEHKIFKDYSVYPTSYGFTLNSIEDAISFNNVHEAMHLGWIGAIKKSL